MPNDLNEVLEGLYAGTTHLVKGLLDKSKRDEAKDIYNNQKEVLTKAWWRTLQSNAEILGLNLEEDDPKEFDLTNLNKGGREIQSSQAYQDYLKSPHTTKFDEEGNAIHSDYDSFDDYLSQKGLREGFLNRLSPEGLKTSENIVDPKNTLNDLYLDFNKSMLDLSLNPYGQPYENSLSDMYAHVKEKLKKPKKKEKKKGPTFVGLDQGSNSVIFRDADNNIIVKEYETSEDKYIDYRKLPIVSNEDGTYTRHEILKRPNGEYELKNTGVEATKDAYEKQEGMYKNYKSYKNNKKYSTGDGYTKNKLGYVPGGIKSEYYELLNEASTNGLDDKSYQRFLQVIKILDDHGINKKMREEIEKDFK